jgi:hypothetical protein
VSEENSPMRSYINTERISGMIENTSDKSTGLEDYRVLQKRGVSYGERRCGCRVERAHLESFEALSCGGQFRVWRYEDHRDKHRASASGW